MRPAAVLLALLVAGCASAGRTDGASLVGDWTMTAIGGRTLPVATMPSLPSSMIITEGSMRLDPAGKFEVRVVGEMDGHTTNTGLTGQYQVHGD